MPVEGKSFYNLSVIKFLYRIVNLNLQISLKDSVPCASVCKTAGRLFFLQTGRTDS